MIDLGSIRRLLDSERRTVAEEGRIVETLPHISRMRSFDGSHHTISFSSLSDATADSVIAEQAAHYRALGIEVEWKVYQHDNPPELLERIERHGFEAGPCETVLVLDLRDRLNWIDEASAQVIRVENTLQVELFRSAAEEIFKKNYEFTASELLSAIESGSARHRAYMVIDGNAAVSIGRLHTHPQSVFGGLYGGGTLEQYRGRGFYRATVAARAKDAVKLGARYLIVDALPTSRPILENLGFVRLTTTWPCTLKL
ncbi:MAG: GNAT family N-acetyltransferase [Candidatus Baltobacteraceae bacterium]